MNKVEFILEFRPLRMSDKLAIKKQGRPTPNIDLTTPSTRSQKGMRFDRVIYDKYPWMCGCPIRNKLFCFVCLVNPHSLNEKLLCSWNNEGYGDLKHLDAAASAHVQSRDHLRSVLDFSFVCDKDDQLDATYLERITLNNKTSNRNRKVFRRLITLVKERICDPITKDHDGQSNISNQISLSFDFTRAIRAVLESSSMKNEELGASIAIIQHNLLQAMMNVCKNEILEQISQSAFLAIEADIVPHKSNEHLLVLIFRYVCEGEVVERFWKSDVPVPFTVCPIADLILKELNCIQLPHDKLIAQSYGSVCMEGVQWLVREVYPHAYFIHSYAHHYTVILEKASYSNKQLKVFFSHINSFSAFFLKFIDAPIQYGVQHNLDEIKKFNFKTETISTVYCNQETLNAFLSNVVDVYIDSKTVSDASALLQFLRCKDFLFFLRVLLIVSEKVKWFFTEIEAPVLDFKHVENCLNELETNLSVIKQSLAAEEVETEQSPSVSKRAKVDDLEDNVACAQEYCNVLVAFIRDMFAFTGHVSASQLFATNKFGEYLKKFPEPLLSRTVGSYDFLDEDNLRTELKTIYKHQFFTGVPLSAMLKFFFKTHLESTFPEAFKLLSLISTTPMDTTDLERCRSKLSSVKTFFGDLHQSLGSLDIYATLTIEKDLIKKIPDFDHRVIQMIESNSKQ